MPEHTCPTCGQSYTPPAKPEALPTHPIPKNVHYEIWTDGACSPNPGRGGWGVVIADPDSDYTRELSGAQADCTNNIMEMTAVIKALEVLPYSSQIKLHSDSAYVCNAFKEGWLDKWQKNNWRTSNKKPVKNKDLWIRLLELSNLHEIEWIWVKGHADDPNNERADELAVAARKTLE